MNELFDPNTTEVVTELQPQGLVISTSMVEIRFKQTTQVDTVIDAGRGVLPINVINGIADQHIQHMARLIYDVQAAVEGLDAIGSGTVHKPSTYFQQGIMRDEYRALCTEAQIVRAERLWAEFLGHWTAVKELIQERTLKLSTQAPMQFGYVGALGASYGFKPGPLLSAEQALQYRMVTYTKRLAAQRNYQDKSSGRLKTSKPPFLVAS
jgi:hypothetical protein